MDELYFGTNSRDISFSQANDICFGNTVTIHPPVKQIANDYFHMLNCVRAGDTVMVICRNSGKGMKTKRNINLLLCGDVNCEFLQW